MTVTGETRRQQLINELTNTADEKLFQLLVIEPLRVVQCKRERLPRLNPKNEPAFKLKDRIRAFTRRLIFRRMFYYSRPVIFSQICLLSFSSCHTKVNELTETN